MTLMSLGINYEIHIDYWPVRGHDVEAARDEPIFITKKIVALPSIGVMQGCCRSI